MLEIIYNAVQSATGIENMEKNTRKTEYVIARGMVYYLARKYTLYGYSKIAKFVGGRNHASAINGKREFENSYLPYYHDFDVKENLEAAEGMVLRNMPVSYDEIKPITRRPFNYRLLRRNNRIMTGKLCQKNLRNLV